MKKILFFVESLAGGGAEKVLLTLIKNLDKTKYDVTVFTVVKTGVYVEEIEKYCKVLYALDDYSKLNITNKLIYKIKLKFIYALDSKLIYKYLIKNKYDIEVAFLEGFATKIISNSNNKNSKKLAWVHIDIIERPYADTYYRNVSDQKNAYSKFDKVVCVSNSVKKSYINKFNLHNSIVVYNPIEKKAIQKYKKGYKIHNPIRICTVGRLESQKGYDRLIECMNEVKKTFTNFHLFIFGQGSQELYLQNIIENKSLNEQITLMGFKNNIYEYMAEMDLFVCSSRSEGYSLVIAEAMCLGLPILTTNCSGPNELTDYGKYGFLVENNDESLYKGMLYLLENKDELEKYHQFSLDRESFFDINTVIKNVEELLDE